MLTKRSTLGLNVILLIAGTPSHRTITADTLASMTDVCLSYIEGILKDAREQGLIRATRGPGGGYQRAGDERRQARLPGWPHRGDQRGIRPARGRLAADGLR